MPPDVCLTVVCWTALMSYVVLMSHMVMPEARVHASDLFIPNDMGGSDLTDATDAKVLKGPGVT